MEFSIFQRNYKPVYDMLMEQTGAVIKLVKEHQIDSYESLCKNIPARDALLLRLILLQKLYRIQGIAFFQRKCKIPTQIFKWLENDYYDDHHTIHYDCVWDMIGDVKSLRRMAKRILELKDTEVPLPADGNNPIYCSFCGKSQENVERIIAGPHAYICNECVDLCGEILVDCTLEGEGENEDDNKA